MQSEYIVFGLILDILGVVVLVAFTDRAISLTLGKLGRVVSGNFEEITEKAKGEIRRVTIIGTSLLVSGFVVQIMGILM